MSSITRPRFMVFTQTPVAAELQRLGITAVEPLDFIFADPLLSVAAAVHVSGGRVQLCPEVRTKPFPLGAAADDDPLSLAVLAGVADGARRGPLAEIERRSEAAGAASPLPAYQE